jgi:hypothetical protein
MLGDGIVSLGVVPFATIDFNATKSSPKIVWSSAAMMGGLEVLKKHKLGDRAILQIAEIVRGADTARFDLAQQAAG